MKVYLHLNFTSRLKCKLDYKTVISDLRWYASDQYGLLITVGGVGGVGGDFSQTDFSHWLHSIDAGSFLDSLKYTVQSFKISRFYLDCLQYLSFISAWQVRASVVTKLLGESINQLPKRLINEVNSWSFGWLKALQNVITDIVHLIYVSAHYQYLLFGAKFQVYSLVLSWFVNVSVDEGSKVSEWRTVVDKLCRRQWAGFWYFKNSVNDWLMFLAVNCKLCYFGGIIVSASWLVVNAIIYYGILLFYKSKSLV